MKKKYLAAILGVMIATTSVTACGAATTETTTNTTESSENKETEDTKAESEESADDSDSSADADKEDSDEEDVTYGEVKSVEDGKITIAVGTMKEMGGNGGTPGGDQGEAPSMLDLTGNEMTVTVTDDTVITKESAGDPGGAPGEIREKPRRNRTVTAQMEMVREKPLRSQTEIMEMVRPQAVIRAVRRTAIIPRVRPSNSQTSRKVTS